MKPNPKTYWFDDGWPNPVGLPDFLTDLNAAHEMEKVLRCGGENSQYERYSNLLRETLDLEAVSATAAQRAEAFLRTIGKWVEES